MRKIYSGSDKYKLAQFESEGVHYITRCFENKDKDAIDWIVKNKLLRFYIDDTSQTSVRAERISIILKSQVPIAINRLLILGYIHWYTDYFSQKEMHTDLLFNFLNSKAGIIMEYLIETDLINSSIKNAKSEETKADIILAVIHTCRALALKFLIEEGHFDWLMSYYGSEVYTAKIKTINYCISTRSQQIYSFLQEKGHVDWYIKHTSPRERIKDFARIPLSDEQHALL